MKGQILNRVESLPDITVTIGTAQRVRIDTLKNVQAIHLNCTTAAGNASLANMNTDIAQVRVNIGGQDIVRATPAQLWARYHYYMDKNTVITPAGDLPLWFMPPEMALSSIAKYWRLGMKANADPQSTMANQMIVEVTYLSPGGGLTITRVQPWLECDDDDPEQLGDHIRFLPFNSTFATTGNQDIDNLERVSPVIGARAYFFPINVGTIASWTVRENSSFLMTPNTPVTVHQMQQRNGGRAPQANWEVLDFAYGNDPTSFEAIAALNSFIVTPTWSVLPGAYTLMQELLCRGL
jgi:hypothetical protein